MIDFSSWHNVLVTLIGLALVTLIGMGMRLVMMFTIQQRQQRMNRQINERLRTLMAAYKVLGGSFTGMLTVDPRSPRKYREEAASAAPPTGAPGVGTSVTDEGITLTEVAPAAAAGLPQLVIERRVQMRNAVEAALSDVLLLGTEEHVRLAGKAAAELAAGQRIHTAELVVSLRNYIRKALDLETIPPDVAIPAQGPTRPAAAGGSRTGKAEGGEADRQRGGGGGGMGMGMGMGGGGMGMGMGLRGTRDTDPGGT